MLIVVDTETTGLHPETDAIIEIAAVVVDGGEIGATWSTLVYPGRKYLQPAQRRTIETICHLDPWDLLAPEVPHTRDAAQMWVEWLMETAGEVARVTSYNAAFDRKFLDTCIWEPTPFDTAIEWAPCVMLAAAERLGQDGVLEKRRDGQWKWPKLPVACQHLGIEFTETHRALNDAMAAARIAIALGVA